MSVEDFYEMFKEALNYIGTRFRGMSEAIIYYRDGKIVVEYDNKEASFSVPNKDDK